MESFALRTASGNFLGMTDGSERDFVIWVLKINRFSVLGNRISHEEVLFKVVCKSLKTYGANT